MKNKDISDDEELSEIGIQKYCEDVNQTPMVRVAAQLTAKQ